MLKTYLTSDDLQRACFERSRTHGDVHCEWRGDSPVLVSGDRVVGVVEGAA